MDLFWGMNTPGPGIDPDEPRKKGIRRVIELLLRDASGYLLANMICLLAFLPVVVAVCYGIYGGSLPFTAAAGAVLGVPAGIALLGVYDTVLRSLRDEPGYWWPTYRRALAQNLRLSVPVGALLGATLGMIAFTAYWNLRANPEGGLENWLAPAGYGLLFALLFSAMLPQAVLLDISFVQLLKNSLFFAFGKLPRVGAAALIAAAYWLATVALFPYSTIFLPMLGFWFVSLLSCMLTYPPLDEIFKIEETLKKRRDEMLERESMFDRDPE